MGGETGEKFQIGDVVLELVNFFEPRETFIEGGEMIRRAKELGAANLKHKDAEKLFNQLPKEWVEYDLVFSKKSRPLCGRRYIPYFHFHRAIGRWVVGRGFVDFDWDRRTRLLRICG